MTPFDYLSLFFDQRIIDLVIEKTNRYAEQIGQRDSAWRSASAAWKNCLKMKHKIHKNGWLRG